MSTDVLERTDSTTDEDIVTSTDKPKSSHIVRSPNANETHQAYVMRAMVEGFEVEALCGYRWIPHRSAKDLPVCQECKDIWDSLPDDGEGWVKE